LAFASVALIAAGFAAARVFFFVAVVAVVFFLLIAYVLSCRDSTPDMMP
jgi:hypothetical protein